jgi:hypothetical protein
LQNFFRDGISCEESILDVLELRAAELHNNVVDHRRQSRIMDERQSHSLIGLAPMDLTQRHERVRTEGIHS